MAPLDVRRLTVVDESGVHLAMTRVYGRAPRGKRVTDAVPQNDGPKITIVGALGLEGRAAVMPVDAAIDAEVFLAAVEHVLAPT